MSFKEEKQTFRGYTKTRVFGLKFKHVKCFKNKDCRGGKYLEITVPHFKNQKNEWHQLVKRFATPCCGKPASECLCPYFDLMDMRKVIWHWRRNRRTDPSPFNRGGSMVPMCDDRVSNLAMGPEDFVFVNTGGFKWRYEQFRLTTKHMTEVFNLSEEQKITPHCFRVGATSLAYIQGIPCLVVCFYAEWSVASLKITHVQYVKIADEWTLANVAYDILHGWEHAGSRYNCINEELTRFVLRKDLILSEVYGVSYTNSCKKRLKKKKKPRMKFRDPESNFAQFGSSKEDFE